MLVTVSVLTVVLTEVSMEVTRERERERARESKKVVERINNGCIYEVAMIAQSFLHTGFPIS